MALHLPVTQLAAALHEMPKRGTVRDFSTGTNIAPVRVEYGAVNLGIVIMKFGRFAAMPSIFALVVGVVAIGAVATFDSPNSPANSTAHKIKGVRLVSADMSRMPLGSDVLAANCQACTVNTQCGPGFGCIKNGRCVVKNPPECRY